MFSPSLVFSNRRLRSNRPPWSRPPLFSTVQVTVPLVLFPHSRFCSSRPHVTPSNRLTLSKSHFLSSHKPPPPPPPYVLTARFPPDAESRSDPESSQNSEAEDTVSEKETKKVVGTALKTAKKTSKKNRGR
jgi:hypothetical protein